MNPPIEPAVWAVNLSRKLHAKSPTSTRVLDLLKRVGFHHPQGVRLRDLISESGLDRSTTHRLLACLLDAGFVERAAPGKLYRLGMEAMQLGLLSASMVPVVERFRPVMQRIARQTADSAGRSDPGR